MRFLPSSRRSALVLTALGGLLLGAGCDDDPVSPEPWLMVSSSTTGAAFDPDGYVVLIDGTPAPRRLGLTDALPVTGVAGAVELELTDVAENCAADDVRRTVALTAGDVTEVAFQVHCSAPAELASVRLIFVRDGPNDERDLYEMRADGTGVLALTSDGVSLDPAVSRDGSFIAYVRRRSGPTQPWDTEIRVMGAAWQDLGAITDGEAYVASPSWSPDGRRIVYQNGDGFWWGEIRVRDLAGGDPVVFPTPGVDGTPSWSPDGSRIAFGRWSDGGLGLYTMNPDGTDVTRLAFGAWNAVWSPSSDRIAVSVEGDAYLVSSENGASPDPVLWAEEEEWEPTGWSPNGDWIVLDGRRVHQDGAVRQTDVFLLHAEDGTLLRVTTDGRSHSAVAAAVP